jgi:cyclic beta-1,2-glucan synthetase
VPGLAINEEKSLDVVVSPYSTFLGLLVDVGGSIENIRKMRELGWLGTYGFYEAGDFTASRAKSPSKFEIVRCWLAHHQGMSLMAVANVLCNASSQRRFHTEPMVAATERLLHEKAPRVTPVEVASAAEDSAAAAAEGGLSHEDWSAAAKLNAV